MRDTDWQILQALYKNPNMTKVANSFYMTQPSLTKRLKQMEEEFGVTIVRGTLPCRSGGAVSGVYEGDDGDAGGNAEEHGGDDRDRFFLYIQ